MNKVDKPLYAKSFREGNYVRSVVKLDEELDDEMTLSARGKINAGRSNDWHGKPYTL